MFHAVLADTPTWPWAVSMADFRSYLDFIIEQGYRSVTVAELAAGEETRAGRSVAITFDDGYGDNWAAFEELRRRRFRASWFIVTGSIGKTPDWPDPGRPPGRMLDAGELREIATAGFEIGSHGVSHTRLTTLSDDALHQELYASRHALQDLLGVEVSSFAYPYGDWDERVETAVRAAGYRAACNTKTGWAMLDRDPLRIRRLTVFNDDGVGRVARKLALASHDVGWMDMLLYGGQRLAARLTGRP